MAHLKTKGLEMPTDFRARARDTVAGLRRDNAQMLKDLVADTRRLRQAKESTLVDDTAALRERSDVLAREISEAKHEIRDMDSSISKLKDAVLLAKRKIGGVHAPQENSRALKRHKEMLDARIAHAKQRLNKARSENEALLGRIALLRRERVVFDGVYRRLEATLQQRRKEMHATVKKAEEAYRAREAAQQRVERLRVHAEREAGKFDADWRAYGRELEEDRTAKEAVLHRIQAAADGRLKGQGPGERTPAAVKAATAKTQRMQWLLAADSMRLRNAEGELGKREEALRDVEAETGMGTVQEMMARFLEAEEENYSMFTHVGALNRDVEAAEAEVAEMAKEIDRLRDARAAETERQTVVRGLREQLEAARGRAGENRAQSSEIEAQSRVFLAAVGELFETLACDQSELAAPLAGHSVTEVNVMQFMGIIEQRVVELIRRVQSDHPVLARKEGFSTELPAPPQPVEFNVEPPRVGDEYGGAMEEEDERPLSRAELADRITRTLGRFDNVRVHTLVQNQQNREAPSTKPSGTLPIRPASGTSRDSESTASFGTLLSENESDDDDGYGKSADDLPGDERRPGSEGEDNAAVAALSRRSPLEVGVRRQNSARPTRRGRETKA